MKPKEYCYSAYLKCCECSVRTFFKSLSNNIPVSEIIRILKKHHQGFEIIWIKMGKDLIYEKQIKNGEEGK